MGGLNTGLEALCFAPAAFQPAREAGVRRTRNRQSELLAHKIERLSTGIARSSYFR